MSRLLNLGVSNLLSGGIINHGTADHYVSNLARQSLGMGLAELQDGQVHYFSKDKQILKRAAIQTASQLTYGTLRSYPRFLKYWEQVERDKYLKTKSQTSIANKNGHYYQLIQEQEAIAEKKNYSDTIVGNLVKDYLELSISKESSYYDANANKILHGEQYGIVKFVDLQPQIQISSKNNIILTTVQGRDYTRKEFISGGDVEISISGKITSKYPDIYPDTEVSKFLKLMQFKGVIDCDSTILKQFKVKQIIIQSYSLSPSDCRNVQPYSLSCIAVEPSEAVEVKIAREEEIDKSISDTNKWIQLVKFGTEVIDPASLLKISKLWI